MDFFTEWTEEEINMLEEMSAALRILLTSKHRVGLTILNSILLRPLAEVTVLYVGGEIVVRQVGSNEANDPSWKISVRAPNVMGVFVCSPEGWISRPLAMAETTDRQPVAIIDRRLGEAGIFCALLGAIVQLSARRDSKISDIVFEALLSRRMANMLEYVRDENLVRFSLEKNISMFHERFRQIERALTLPCPQLELNSWETLQIRIMGVCQGCNQETEIFTAKLDPNEPGSFYREIARVDREIGSGTPAVCGECGNNLALIRVYENGDILEEMTLSEFAIRYGYNTKDNKPNAGFG